MIYAIRAVGTQFVKIGKAKSVGKRLKELETGCPHELHIEAVADWPDPQEKAVHLYLKAHCEKYEWFRDSEATAQVIQWMHQSNEGLRAFRVAFLKACSLLRMPKRLTEEYQPPSKDKKLWRKPRMPLPPSRARGLSREERRRLQRLEYWEQRSKAAQQSRETCISSPHVPGESVPPSV